MKRKSKMKYFFVILVFLFLTSNAQAKEKLKVKKIDFETSSVMIGKKNSPFGTMISIRRRMKKDRFNLYRKNFRTKIRQSVNSL